MLICYILTSTKLLFDLGPLIQFTIFEENPCKIEEKPCKCSSEEESIHFEEMFRVYIYRCHGAYETHNFFILSIILIL